MQRSRRPRLSSTSGAASSASTSASLRVSGSGRPSCGMAISSVGSSAISPSRSEEHTSELQSRENLVCRLLLEKKKHNQLQHVLIADTPITNHKPKYKIMFKIN